MGAFDECEPNGDIPKAQKRLLDSKNSSFFGKNAFLGRKIKFSIFFRKVAKWGFSTTANRMVIFLKLKNFFLIVKIDIFILKRA